MTRNEAINSIGQTVTFWDEHSREYRSGIVIEVYDDTREIVIDSGQIYVVPLRHAHAGSMEEIVNNYESDFDEFLDLEDDVDPDHYGKR